MMMKIFLSIFALITCCSGFFLGGLLGEEKHREVPHRPPPQRHLVKIISEQPRHALNLGHGNHLNNGISGLANIGHLGQLNNHQHLGLSNNGQAGLGNNGHLGLINNGNSDLLNNGLIGLSSGQGLNSVGPVTIIRVIHEGLQSSRQLNQNGVLRVLHEHINVPSPGVINSLGHVQNNLGPVHQSNQPLGLLGSSAPVGHIPLGQGSLGPAHSTPLISSPIASLLPGSHSAQSYQSGGDHGYSYSRGG